MVCPFPGVEQLSGANIFWFVVLVVVVGGQIKVATSHIRYFQLTSLNKFRHHYGLPVPGMSSWSGKHFGSLY